MCEDDHSTAHRIWESLENHEQNQPTVFVKDRGSYQKRINRGTLTRTLGLEEIIRAFRHVPYILRPQSIQFIFHVNENDKYVQFLNAYRAGAAAAAVYIISEYARGIIIL